MNKCKNCKHWNKERIGDIFNLNVAYDSGVEYHPCLLIESPSSWPPNSDGFFTTDVEKAGCSDLCTGPEFGCVNFQERTNGN
jgi:hypothetical protein